MTAGTKLNQSAYALVSVVIPTYNRAPLLPEAIESVLSQTYKKIEVIVVDDGSTDNTPEVLIPYQGRIRYIRQPNLERAAARNRGLEHASGEFIAFLDSDDVWYDDKIQAELAAFASNPDLGLVFSDFELWREANGKSELIAVRRFPSFKDGFVTPLLLKDNFIACSSNLMRTQSIRKIGGFNEDRALSGSEDWDAWTRLSVSEKIGHIGRITTRLRQHGNNTMTDLRAMERAMIRSCEIIETPDYLPGVFRHLLRERRGHVYLINAINHLHAGQRRKSIRWLSRSLGCSPFIVLDLRWSYTLVKSIAPASFIQRLKSWLWPLQSGS